VRPIRTLTLAGLLAVACTYDDQVGDDDPSVADDEDPPPRGPDFEFRYHTKYVDIAPGFTEPVCRGTLDEIDRHMEAVATLLDSDVQHRTAMFWYNRHVEGTLADTQEICSWCSRCGGCYSGNKTIHLTYRSLFHELAHAVVAPAWGSSDTLFEEGIAMGLDRIRGTYGSVPTIYPVLGYDTKPSDVAGSRKHGGAHFSRWLVDRFGPAPFREMFERLNQTSTKEQVFAAVEAVYGLPFEELEAEYFATAATVYPLPGLCEGHLNIPWDGDRWELRLDTDCDAPHMFGPSDLGHNFIVVTVDIPPEYEGMTIASWTPSDASSVVWPCVEEPLYDIDHEIVRINRISNNGPTNFRMGGRHRLEIPVLESGEIYMRLCPDNGKFPGTYPIDKSIDPENCLGD